jgi:hypothetical protein
MALDPPGDHLTEDLGDRPISGHSLERLPCRAVDLGPSRMPLLVTDCGRRQRREGGGTSLGAAPARHGPDGRAAPGGTVPVSASAYTRRRCTTWCKCVRSGGSAVKQDRIRPSALFVIAADRRLGRGLRCFRTSAALGHSSCSYERQAAAKDTIVGATAAKRSGPTLSGAVPPERRSTPAGVCPSRSR